MAKQTETKNFLNDTARINLGTYYKLLIKRYLSRNVKTRPLYVMGHMGIGKSQTVYQVAKALSEEIKQNVEVICVSMHCMEAPDWNGLSYVQDAKTFFAQPYLLPKDGHGILFLDEFNRAPKDLHQAALTLIENREINGHALGKDWIIVTAGNPTQDVTDVLYAVKELDPALKDRLATYMLSPTTQEVIDFLRVKYGNDNKVVRWITSEPNIISLDGKGKTSPRSLEYLIRSLDINNDLDVFTIAAGEIGNSAAIQFQNFVNSPQSLSLKDLLDMTAETKSIINGLNADKKKALAEGKMSDVSIVQQWINLLYNHILELKSTGGSSFSLKNHPKETNALAEFLYLMDNYEWIMSFTTKIGSLYQLREDIEEHLFFPILKAKEGLKEKLSKQCEESIKREESERKMEQEKQEKAAKAKK